VVLVINLRKFVAFLIFFFNILYLGLREIIIVYSSSINIGLKLITFSDILNSKNGLFLIPKRAAHSFLKQAQTTIRNQA